MQAKMIKDIQLNGASPHQSFSYATARIQKIISTGQKYK
jgi:hypothetical protein